MALHEPASLRTLGACQIRGSHLLTATPSPPSMVLVLSRCSIDADEIGFPDEDTGAQGGQGDGLNATCLVRSSVAVSLLSLPLPASLFALGSQHHPQPTKHLSVCSITHFFPSKPFLPSPYRLHWLPYSFGQAELLESLSLKE